ncbi:MAG: nitroreductase family protein [Phycisphaerales bacterium]|nr:nitroreductase family protein [Phycisphaerales bacterium]
MAGPEPITPGRLLSALQWRYATQRFDPSRPIPAAAWSAILESLRLAPSGFGLQPWRIVSVESPALRRALSAASWNQPQVLEAPRLLVLCRRDRVESLDVERLIALARGQRAISDEEAARWRAGLASFVESGAATDQWAARQVYLALGVLVAAAAVLGVDACPLEGIDPPAYDRELGLAGTGYQTVVAVALGYRAAGDPAATADKLRFPEAEVFTRA